MSEYRTFEQAFAYFGAVKSNPRACWSGASPDGSVIVLAFWNATRQWTGQIHDLFGLDLFGDGTPLPWVSMPGNNLRRRHIKHALSELHGRVRALLVEPTRPDASRYEPLVRRANAPIRALPGWFEIRRYDPVTGAFVAEAME